VDPCPYPDTDWIQGRAKMTRKHRKRLIIFLFCSADCWMLSFLKAEGFFCSLDISKLQFFIQKNFHLYFFSLVFGHQNPGSGLDPYPDPDSLKILDPDQYLDPDAIVYIGLDHSGSR
jgi:hypothetical protein